MGQPLQKSIDNSETGLLNYIGQLLSSQCKYSPIHTQHSLTLFVVAGIPPEYNTKVYHKNIEI